MRAVAWLALTATFGWASAPLQGPVQFSDITHAAGLMFDHENGQTPEKYLPETMSGGGVIFDFDRDGWPDVFLVNGGSFADPARADAARHRLYRNQGDGTFRDVTDASGIGVSGYGVGACAADYDNDGWTDLYVTSVGPNRLYRNASGTGEFEDVTDRAGVGYDGWSASCALADVDNDGNVDLYVTNYLDFSVEGNQPCADFGMIRRYYCHPNVYEPLSDVLYHNLGDGSFADVSVESGITSTQAYGLGVVFDDYDDDGWIDIYVANDSVPNFLFHNNRDGTFVEMGLFSGVAVGSDGKPLAGMGTDSGDIDGDGLREIFVTNLARETHNLYRNLGDGLFAEGTYETGIGEATLPFVGFGTTFLDFDNDRDLDLAVGNGDVLDNVALLRPGETYPQRNLLLENDGTGRFVDVAPQSGPGFALTRVSRALVTGDIDNDGDLDVLVVNNGQGANLLRNDAANGNNSLLVRVEGTRSNRDGIGARLRLWVGDDVLVRTIKAGSSYLGQNDLRAHFGMGAEPRASRLEIQWPGGGVDVVEDVTANRILTFREGEGITGAQPFSR